MRRLAVCALLAALALPGAAGAATTVTVYDDCQDNGRLDRRYPKPVLRQALDEMGADADQYTNCREVIRDQLWGRRGPGGAGPGSTHEDRDGYGALSAGEGGLPLGPDGRPIDPRGVAAPAERTAVDRAREGAGLPPQVSGVAPAQHGADLPASLAALLATLGAAAAALAGPRLWRRASERRG
ncbi:MAG TPA: hypothetical protein VGW75_08365 [Solirubrobacteraceae bacterium]|jgi:hypothetical protein|nr:hypothetical protein [Solirubrobacteraceae bacterium]